MIELKIHNVPGATASRTIAIPGSWEELTGEQFLNVSNALYGITDATERLAYICLCLMGRKNARTLPAETLIADVFPVLDWIETQPAVTEQRIPCVQVGLRKYYGPESDFNNLKMVEYDFADRELFMFLLAKKEADIEKSAHHLWRFAACLYRPGKWLYNSRKDKDGDIRIKFNENTLNYHANKMRRHLPDGFAFATLLWFKACRVLLTQLYPAVFKRAEDDTPADTYLELPNHFNLMRKIAEKGTYGTYDKVEEQYLHTILLELEKSIVEAEELKRQSRS